MNDIEQYAVNLVGEGAASYAEDDIDEGGAFADRDDWKLARALGLRMGTTIKNNPEAFLAWYVSIAPVATA